MATNKTRDIMSQQISNAKPRVGTCPHGMPIGACPICNGSSVGGSARKPGEMTWSQCFAEGLRMKNAKLLEASRQDNPIYNVNVALKLKQDIAAYSDRVKQTIAILQNSLPPGLSKLINVLNQILIKPFLTILETIPKIIESVQKFTENIRTTISQVCEKLTAILGEINNFVNKNLSDFMKKARKKVFGFLFEQGMEEEEGLDEKGLLEVFSSKR